MIPANLRTFYYIMLEPLSLRHDLECLTINQDVVENALNTCGLDAIIEEDITTAVLFEIATGEDWDNASGN
jgi:hypothetical protein